MVGLRPLKAAIGVRIPGPEPNKKIEINFDFFVWRHTLNEVPACRSFSEGGGNDKELPFRLAKFNVFDIIILNMLIYTHYK